MTVSVAPAIVMTKGTGNLPADHFEAGWDKKAFDLLWSNCKLTNPLVLTRRAKGVNLQLRKVVDLMIIKNAATTTKERLTNRQRKKKEGKDPPGRQ